MSKQILSLNNSVKKHFKDKSDEYLYVIELLSENDIEICLLNLPVNINYQSNPSDLDIVIKKLDFDKCIRILEENKFIKTRLFVDTDQTVLSRKSTNGSYLVNIHIHQNLCFHGIELYDFKRLVENSKKYENRLYYPNYSLEREILLFESFYKNKISYRDKISLFKDNVETYTERKYLYKYIKYFYNKSIYNRVIRYCSILTSLNYFLGFFKYLYEYIKDAFSRLISRRGTLVFYLGVDGSGKTTQCEKLNLSLNKRGFHCSSVYMGLKVTLPQRLKSYLYKKDIPRFAPNRTSLGVLNKIKSSILDLIYLVNYVILFRLSYNKLRSSRSVVLIDRCHLDLIHRLNYFTKILYSFSLPSPDYLFLLEGSIEKIAARKNEYSVKDTKLLNNNIAPAVKFLEESKKTKILKINTTEKSIEDISDLTTEYLINNFHD